MTVLGFEKLAPLSADCESKDGEGSPMVLDRGILYSSVVGLGEVAHGSESLHRVAGRLISALASSDGKPVQVLLENPNSLIVDLARKIEEGALLVETDMNGLYQVWRTPGMLEVLNEFSRINRFKPRQIVLVGFDIRQPILEFKSLSKVQPRLKSLSMFRDASEIREIEMRIAGGGITEAQRSKLKDLERDLKKIDHSIPGFLKVHHWVRTYASADGVPLLFERRDRGMYEVLKTMIRPTTHNVVWAHFGHLLYDSRKIETAASYLTKLDVFGTLLKRDLKDDYKLIAVAQAKTRFLGPNRTEASYLNSQEDSIEAKLEPGYLYRCDHRAFKDNKVLIISKTDGTLADKEAFPEIKMSSPQFDYLLLGLPD